MTMNPTAYQPRQRAEVPQGILDKIANAKPTSTRHANIRDGYYLWEVRQLLSETKRNEKHCFIIELGVVASRTIDDPTRTGIAPNAAQSTCSSVVDFAKDSAPGNVQKFVLGLLGMDPDQMSMTDEAGNFVRWMTVEERAGAIKATYAELVGANQPGRGMLVRGSTYCYPIKTGPNAGKPFVGVNWIPVNGQTEETIALRRQMIDAGGIGSPLSQAEIAAGILATA